MFDNPTHLFWPRTWTILWAGLFLGDALLSQSIPEHAEAYRLGYWLSMGLIFLLSKQWKHFCHRFRLQTSYFKHWQRSPISHSGILFALLSLIVLSGLLLNLRQLNLRQPSLSFKPLESLLLIGFCPFIEELLFRGWLQPILSSRTNPLWSIMLTAVFFTLCHQADWTHPLFLLPILLLGLSTSFLRQRYNSLWPGFLLHASYNFISMMSG